MMWKHCVFERARMACSPYLVVAENFGRVLRVRVTQHAQQRTVRDGVAGLQRKRLTYGCNRFLDARLLEHDGGQRVLESGVARFDVQAARAACFGFVVAAERFEERRQRAPGFDEFRLSADGSAITCDGAVEIPGSGKNAAELGVRFGRRRDFDHPPQLPDAFLGPALRKQRGRQQFQDVDVVGPAGKRRLAARDDLRIRALLLQAECRLNPARVDFRCVRRRGSARTEQAL